VGGEDQKRKQDPKRSFTVAAAFTGSSDDTASQFQKLFDFASMKPCGYNLRDL
jgi:hypothetical protein